MDSLPIKYLEQLTTISTLKVLISFLKKGNENGLSKIDCPIGELEEELGLSRNTVKSAIDELMELGIVIPVRISSGKRPNRYELILPKQEAIKPVVQKRKPRAKKVIEQTDIINLIREMEITTIDFLQEDINSIGATNYNENFNKEELSMLSNRIVKEYLYPRITIDRRIMPQWFSTQTSIGAELLNSYRIEQILAGISYWIDVKRIRQFSLGFLKIEVKMMEALDHYKRIYLSERSHEVANQESKIRLQEIEVAKVAEQEKIAEEKKAVENMSDDDFIKNLLGSFGTVEVRRD